MKVKYKQDYRKEGPLYHLLPETTETQLAKELRGVYSQVRSLKDQRRTTDRDLTWANGG